MLRLRGGVIEPSLRLLAQKYNCEKMICRKWAPPPLFFFLLLFLLCLFYARRWNREWRYFTAPQGRNVNFLFRSRFPLSHTFASDLSSLIDTLPPLSCQGAMLVCTLVQPTAVSVSADTPPTCAWRRSSSKPWNPSVKILYWPWIPLLWKEPMEEGDGTIKNR